ncbi:hypothetical protein TPY_2702 [Sulfobacillus acidophilus TPY]|uniref:Uncharacterized protein n=1 Tax=Sulfobacillus acidophilus (strain ATCC 700253 / DSM 10332 / NAL) TaxID=679936 RepID=G8TUN0_SULAD|nr:hypothetical protein TPY_2702 [Sulfobacillus acidophilus TPY]AEW04677.1 hypothetical protein Sulac_1177 [Sulfobacillus acidophilus DSM 10332]
MVFTFWEMELHPNGTIRETGRHWVYQADSLDDALQKAVYFARLTVPGATIAPSHRGIDVTTTPQGVRIGWYYRPD